MLHLGPALDAHPGAAPLQLVMLPRLACRAARAAAAALLPEGRPGCPGAGPARASDAAGVRS
jgi:hypothetical protein